MSEHKMTLTWKRATPDFQYQTTTAITPGNLTAATKWRRQPPRPISATRKIVDPEEAFVASLSSCHMLTFLAVACKKKFVLDEYVDDAVGHMEKNENGKLAITRVELHPKLKFSGEKQPTEQELDEMHHFAHTECFIANSVKTKVTVEK